MVAQFAPINQCKQLAIYGGKGQRSGKVRGRSLLFYAVQQQQYLTRTRCNTTQTKVDKCTLLTPASKLKVLRKVKSVCRKGFLRCLSIQKLMGPVIHSFCNFFSRPGQAQYIFHALLFANTYYFPILIHYRLGKITSPIFSLEESRHVLSNFLAVSVSIYA